ALPAGPLDAKDGALRTEQVLRQNLGTARVDAGRPDAAFRPLRAARLAFRRRLGHAGQGPPRAQTRAATLGTRLADLRRAGRAVPRQGLVVLHGVLVVRAMGRREDLKARDARGRGRPAAVLDVIVLEPIDEREVVAVGGR